MKKIILLVVIGLLGVTCIQAKAKPEQNPYAQDVEQAVTTLKNINKKIQAYYAKHTQQPEQQNDFAALNMQDPSTKTWQYTFFCEDDIETPDRHACNVFAEQKTPFNTWGQRFFLQMQMPAKKHNKFGRIIWVSLRQPGKAPQATQTGDAPLHMSASLCAQFKGGLQKGLCVLDGHF